MAEAGCLLACTLAPFRFQFPEMAIVVFVPEHARQPAQYRWAALTATAAGAVVLGPVQTGLTGVPPAAEAILVAPASAVRLTAAKLPAKNRRRLTQLAFVVEDGLAADAATLHAVAGAPQADGQHAVALCERAWLAAVISTVTDAGLLPISMRVETCLPAIATGSWVAVWNGAGGFARTGAMSGLAFDADASGAAPLALRLALGDSRYPPKNIVLRTASGASLPDLAAWSASLGVPMTEGPPWPGIEAGWEKSIDLLSGEFAPKGRFGSVPDILRALRPAALVLAAIVAVQFLLTGTEWLMLHSEQQRLREQMVREFRAAFPDAQQVADPGLQMRRNLAALRGAAGVADDADFLTLAARAAPALQGSRIKLMRYDKGRLDIDAVYPSPQALDNARRLLGAASIQSEKAAATGGIDAHLQLAAGDIS
jgi:type II secretion system protein L